MHHSEEKSRPFLETQTSRLSRSMQSDISTTSSHSQIIQVGSLKIKKKFSVYQTNLSDVYRHFLFGDDFPPLQYKAEFDLSIESDDVFNCESDR